LIWIITNLLASQTGLSGDEFEARNIGPFMELAMLDGGQPRDKVALSKTEVNHATL
jgi:hypothetical protein